MSCVWSNLFNTGSTYSTYVRMYSKGSSSVFCCMLNAVDQYITPFEDDYIGTSSVYVCSFTNFGSAYDRIGDCAVNAMNSWYGLGLYVVNRQNTLTLPKICSIGSLIVGNSSASLSKVHANLCLW